MIAQFSTLLLVSIACASPLIEVRHGKSLVFTPKGLQATTPPACVSTAVVTVTRFIDATSTTVAGTSVTSEVVPPASSSDASSSAVAVVTTAPQENPSSANPTTPVPVSGAGGTLQPSAAAEANKFDAGATRAFTAVSLKDADGKCLFIDPLAGDFRQNIIPIAVQDCTGSANEKFDFITSGAHNNAQNSTLIVSSLTNGCVSFDPRRTVNKAHVFSCGGRADGSGETSNSQLYPFTAGEQTITIAPENENGATCLVDVGGFLDGAACTGDISQTFTIG